MPSWLQQRQRRSLDIELGPSHNKSFEPDMTEEATVSHKPPVVKSATHVPVVEGDQVSPSPHRGPRSKRRRRIVNGEPVDVAQWPFLVAILTPDGPIVSHGYFCCHPLQIKIHYNFFC